MKDLRLNFKVCLTVAKMKDKEAIYYKLYRDYGYKGEVISFNPSFISEALGISVAELHSLELGTYVIN